MDVTRLKSLLGGSQQLLDQLNASLGKSVLATTAEPATPPGPQPAPVSPTVQLTSALNTLAAPPSAAAQQPQFRAVVQQDLPSGIAAEALLTGAPQDFVASAAIDHVLGPVQSIFGPPVVIQFQPIIQAVSLFTVTGLTPLMLLTVETLRLVPILHPQTSFNIPAGSVWLLSQLLLPTAPANEYIGLTISSGTITFSVAPTLTAGKLTMAATTTVHMHLVLQQPTPATNSASQFGADARALALQLPATFDFHFSTFGAFTGSPGIDTVGPIAVNVFGQALTAFDPATVPIYDAATRTVLFLLTPDAATLTVAQSLSTWSNLEGAAPITLCAWALGSTTIDVAHPTAAAGIGSLLLRTGPGLAARWPGLVDAPLTLAAPQLFLSPESLLLIDLTGTAHVGTQAFQLWQDAQNPHRSTARITVGPSARFQSLSFSSGSEAVGVTCSTVIEADRPVRVNGEPFPLRSTIANVPASLILSGTDVGGTVSRRVALAAPRLLPPPAFPAPLALLAESPPPAFAIALRNALLKVTPAQTASLIGGWDPDTGAVQNGILRVTFHTLSYVPTLPDPYVASLAGLRGPNDRGGFGHGSIPSALGTPWEILRCSVAWTTGTQTGPVPTDPAVDTVTTSFDLLPDPANAAQLAAAGPAPNEPFPDPNAGGQFLAQIPPVTRTDYGAIWDDRSPRPDNCALLDVSTNADLLGVSFRLIRGELMVMLPTQGIARTAPAALQVQGLDVVSQAAAVHAFLLPQVSWEPLLNLAHPQPPVDGDPSGSLLFYPGDGGPSRLLNSNAEPVPLSPLPLAGFLVQQSQADTFDGAALFTLPWALQALARLRTRYTRGLDGVTRRGSQLQLPRQNFRNGLQTALRFQLSAGQASHADLGVSDSFMGATVQRNNVLSASGTQTFTSTLGGSVTKIFNQQFFLGEPGLNLDTGVPLTRIDLSGYGASSFSNWLDPAAVIASTSQAQFELMLGRCAHELVQVESILYPWGIKVVRTITLLRAPSGYTFRNDSGWRAQGDGRFLFQYFVKSAAPGQPPPPVRTATYSIHPGVVRALHNIRNILETKAVQPFTGSMFIPANSPTIDADGNEVPAPGGGVTLPIELQPVFFDADIELDGFVSGAHDRGDGVLVTPSKGILGFVQLQPFGVPLDSNSLAALIARQGSIGGPLNCVLQAGASQQQLRVSSFDFNNAVADNNSPIFSVAARGTALLPKEGSWAVVRHEAATGTVRPLPATAPLPLIRAGRLIADAVTHAIHLETGPATELTRIADPLEVVRQPAHNTLNYGFLFSTDTQKALFLTPSFSAALPDLLSKTPPLFADAFRIASSKAVFPNVGDAVTGFGDAISLLSNGTEFTGPAGILDAGKAVNSLLSIAAGQSYNLLKKVPSFSLPDKEWDLLEFGGAFKLYIEYKTSKDATISPGSLNFDIASDAAAVADKWKSIMGGVAIVVDLGPLNRLITIQGDWNAANGSEAQYGGIGVPTPKMVFSEDLRPVIDILQILQELQGEDYASAVKDGLHLAMGNKADSWEYKLAADKEIPIVHFPPRDVPSPPLILDASLKVGLYLNESLQITTDTNQLLPSAGAFLKFFGRLSVNCFSVGVAAIYAVGQVNLDIAADTAKGPSLGMKFGFGAQVVVAIPVVGNVSVLFVVGVEIYLDKTTLSISASLLYQGQADLLEGLVNVTITIEAKGTITRTPLIGPGGQTTLAAQVTFALDISIFLVIDISFSKSWQEERQIA